MKYASVFSCYCAILSLSFSPLLFAGDAVGVAAVDTTLSTVFSFLKSGKGEAGESVDILRSFFGEKTPSLSKVSKNISNSLIEINPADTKIMIKILEELYLQVVLDVIGGPGHPLLPFSNSATIRLVDKESRLSSIHTALTAGNALTGVVAYGSQDIPDKMADAQDAGSGTLKTIIQYITGSKTLAPEAIFAIKFALVMKQHLSLGEKSFDSWSFAQDVGILFLRLMRSKSDYYKTASIKEVLPDLALTFLEGVSEQLFSSKDVLTEMLDSLWQALVDPHGISFPGGLPAPANVGVVVSGLQFANAETAKKYFLESGNDAQWQARARRMYSASLHEINTRLLGVADEKIKEAANLGADARVVSQFSHKPNVEGEKDFGVSFATGASGSFNSLRVIGVDQGEGMLPRLVRKGSIVYLIHNNIPLVTALRVVLSIVFQAVQRSAFKESDVSAPAANALTEAYLSRWHHNVFMGTPEGEASRIRIEDRFKSAAQVAANDSANASKVDTSASDSLSKIIADAAQIINSEREDATTGFFELFTKKQLTQSRLDAFLTWLRDAQAAEMSPLAGESFSVQKAYGYFVKKSRISEESELQNVPSLLLITLFSHPDLFARLQKLPLYSDIEKLLILMQSTAFSDGAGIKETTSAASVDSSASKFSEDTSTGIDSASPETALVVEGDSEVGEEGMSPLNYFNKVISSFPGKVAFVPQEVEGRVVVFVYVNGVKALHIDLQQSLVAPTVTVFNPRKKSFITVAKTSADQSMITNVGGPISVPYVSIEELADAYFSSASGNTQFLVVGGERIARRTRTARFGWNSWELLEEASATPNTDKTLKIFPLSRERNRGNVDEVLAGAGFKSGMVTSFDEDSSLLPGGASIFTLEAFKKYVQEIQSKADHSKMQAMKSDESLSLSSGSTPQGSSGRSVREAEDILGREGRGRRASRRKVQVEVSPHSERVILRPEVERDRLLLKIWNELVLLLPETDFDGLVFLVDGAYTNLVRGLTEHDAELSVLLDGYRSGVTDETVKAAIIKKIETIQGVVVTILRSKKEYLTDEANRMRALMVIILDRFKKSIEEAIESLPPEASSDAGAKEPGAGDSSRAQGAVGELAQRILAGSGGKVQSAPDRSSLDVSPKVNAYVRALEQETDTVFEKIFDRENTHASLTKALTALNRFGRYPSDAKSFLAIVTQLVPDASKADQFNALQGRINGIAARIALLEREARDLTELEGEISPTYLEAFSVAEVELGGDGHIADDARVKVARFKSEVARIIAGDASHFKAWSGWVTRALRLTSFTRAAKSEALERLRKLAEYCAVVRENVEQIVTLCQLLGLQVTAADVVAGGVRS